MRPDCHLRAKASAAAREGRKRRERRHAVSAHNRKRHRPTRLLEDIHRELLLTTAYAVYILLDDEHEDGVLRIARRGRRWAGPGT